jgi:hypothetical protein
MANKKGPSGRDLALMIVASLVWLGAWIWIRGAFTVWLVMLGVYGVALGASILTAESARRSPAFLEWQGRFFRTSGWVVMSGLFSIAYLVLFGIAVLLFAWLTGRL